MMLSVFSAAEEAPDQLALVTDDRALTYRELARATSAAVTWLRAALPPDLEQQKPLVALNANATLPDVLMVHALIALGIPMLLLHPRYTQRERTHVIEEARPTLVVPQAWWKEPRQTAGGGPDPVPDDERALAIVYTSGTEAQPKGVVLSRRAFAAAARANFKNIGVVPDDRWLLCLPPSHVGGLSILIRCLLARSCVVMPTAVAGIRHLEPRQLTEIVDRHRVTLLSLVPAQLKQLLSLDPPWDPPVHVRAILVGGAAASPAMLSEAAERTWPVLVTYGLTEACAQVATQRYGTLQRGEAGAGAPLPGVELRIVDGRIQVRGPTLLTSYFPPEFHPPALDAEGWFDTGDLGELDAAGRLHVFGRGRDLIITGGENVSPLEVEQVLEQHADVAAACVFGHDDETWGQVVCAAILPRAGGQVSCGDLDRWSRQRLASFKCPRLWAIVSELPHNETGKLDRRSVADAVGAALRASPEAVSRN